MPLPEDGASAVEPEAEADGAGAAPVGASPGTLLFRLRYLEAKVRHPANPTGTATAASCAAGDLD